MEEGGALRGQNVHVPPVHPCKERTETAGFFITNNGIYIFP